MANRKIVLRFLGHPEFKIADQIRPGVTDSYGVEVPEALGSWVIDEIQTRTTALGTTTSVHIIDYTSIPYKD